MDKIKVLDPGTLTDRELLLVMHTQLTNHLTHHDKYTAASWAVAKIALATGLTGLVTFVVGVGLILIRFGLFGMTT